MRELVLDTETTGLDPKDGHRVIELACVELINYIPTGAYWHWYFNPERDVPKAATDVHGLTNQFLANKPLIGAVAPSARAGFPRRGAHDKIPCSCRRSCTRSRSARSAFSADPASGAVVLT